MSGPQWHEPCSLSSFIPPSKLLKQEPCLSPQSCSLLQSAPFRLPGRPVWCPEPWSMVTSPSVLASVTMPTFHQRRNPKCCASCTLEEACWGRQWWLQGKERWRGGAFLGTAEWHPYLSLLKEHWRLKLGPPRVISLCFWITENQ